MSREDLKILKPAKLTMKPFIAKVMPHTNYMDSASIEQIYKGIIRTIVLELRDQGAITLPDFGVFEVTEIEHNKKIKLIHTGELVDVPRTRTVKFRPGKMLKDYFYKITEPMVE